MRLRATLTIVCLCFSVSACSTFQGYPKKPGSPGNTLAEREPIFNEYLTKYAVADQLEQKQLRNDLVRRRMAEIDFVYQNFEKKIHVESVRADAYSQWASNFLDGATGFVSNLGNAQALTAASLFISNGKTTFDNAALVSSTMPALIAEMKASRAHLKTQIIRRIKASANEYDIYSAWSDLNEYYIVGTIPSAIASLNAKAKKAQTQAEDAYFYNTDPDKPLPTMQQDKVFTDRLHRWMEEGEGREAELTEWLGEKNLMLSDVMLDTKGNYKTIKEQAFNELVLRR